MSWTESAHSLLTGKGLSVNRADDNRFGLPEEIWEIVVSGIPKPQPRGRSSGFKRKDGGAGSRIYDPGSADAWKAVVYQEALRCRPPEPLEGPLRVDIDWYLPRPKTRLRKKSHDGPIWCGKIIDRDNLDKAILDALTMVGFWTDDSVVRSGFLRVMEHRKGGRPGVVIRIQREDEIPDPARGGVEP